jgi:hypothetical protein
MDLFDNAPRVFVDGRGALLLTRDADGRLHVSSDLDTMESRNLAAIALALCENSSALRGSKRNIALVVDWLRQYKPRHNITPYHFTSLAGGSILCQDADGFPHISNDIVRTKHRQLGVIALAIYEHCGALIRDFSNVELVSGWACKLHNPSKFFAPQD